MTVSSNRRHTAVRLPALAGHVALVGLIVLGAASPAWSLSQFGPGAPAAEDGSANDGVGNSPDDRLPPAEPRLAPQGIPLPDPLVKRPGRSAATPDDPAAGTAPAQEPEEPVEVLTDVSRIPKPVARMRELIVEAAASGDVERLRPLLGKGETATEIGDGEEEADPVAAIKGLSGDNEGLEILAIMLDLLSTGFTVIDKGTPDEMYVWPYFAAKPLASLTAPEKVDLMRLVTAGDVASMQEFGSYNFYRIGITPDGQWKFFVGGD
jgi:hypothetical protein